MDSKRFSMITAFLIASSLMLDYPTLRQFRHLAPEYHRAWEDARRRQGIRMVEVA